MSAPRTTLTRYNHTRVHLEQIELPNVSDLISWLMNVRPLTDSKPSEYQKAAWAAKVGNLKLLAEDMLKQMKGETSCH